MKGVFSMTIGFHFLDLIIVCLFGFIGFICIFGTIFWIWMIVDCATNEPSEGQDKIMWILIIVLTHFIGACIYFFVRRPARKRTVGH
jgi:Phospholipase_D-nuclease N-terminal